MSEGRNESMRHLSLFTGSGIGDHVAEMCGIETVAQCENDSACLYCLERLFPHAKQFRDVKDVTDDALRSLGTIDIISGGFPCQNISGAGKGEGIEGEKSILWFEMLRIITAARPTWVLVENVPALRVRGADVVLAGLEELGYTCWPLVVGAWATGQAHQRNRIWIVGADSNSHLHGGLQVPGNIFGTPAKEKGHQAEPLPLVPWSRRFSTLMEVPRETDGLAGGLPAKARNALLRMVGNGWSPQIPFLIYRWISELTCSEVNEAQG